MPRPRTPFEFMSRYPRTTAHIVAESLGYATPTKAALIGLDGMNRRDNHCEWISHCYGGDARQCLNDSIKRRH